MTATTVRTIEDYRIVPEQGGGVCVVGTLGGRPWRTTTVAHVHGGDRMVRTASGSTYALRRPHASLWAAQLQMRRPAAYDLFTAFI